MKTHLKITKELTPKAMSCTAIACPAIFKTNNGSYAVIGKKLNAKNLKVDKRVGKDEVLIEIPNRLLENLGDRKTT